MESDLATSARFPIDAFEPLERLGRGASGTVYRARTRRALGDLAAGREVAVKLLSLIHISEPTRPY